MLDQDSLEKGEIFKYVQDERILRALFESNIFELRDIQKEAIRKGLFFRKSFLVCAPSGSGKTLVGELCAIQNVFQNYGKSIYLVPFKALATEKYYYFRKSYSRFGIKVELSIGDYDVEDEKLEKADLIITTYEKMDSILRNFYEKDWIFDISTIIIDEIHMIGESSRGPRLESLIVRLNEFLNLPQIIGLSATINNAEFFNEWLSSLGSETILIKSDKRPVPLHYDIQITHNKDSTTKKIVKTTLEKKGQLLIFLNRRKGTQQQANGLKVLISKYLEPLELESCKEISSKLNEIQGGNKDLAKCVRKGVAFHHAGLLPKERRLVEDNYRKRLIKVICCTTTLSAGVNTPARTVIVKDFKRITRSGYMIKDFKGFYECGDGFSFFKPFSSNEVFQMLGRAGRPGLDPVGYGKILVNNMDERLWIEDNYFNCNNSKGKMVPRYNDLLSGLNKVNTLKEQVLLRIYEEKDIDMAGLKRFFEKTYFWYCMKDRMKNRKIPIDQLLMIKEISPINILKLHSEPKKVSALLKKKLDVKVSKYSSSNISGYLKTDYGVYTLEFDVDNGIRCTCGFENGISDNFVADEFAFEFCDHITAFLMHLIRIPNKNFQKYVNDVVPKAVKNQYILSYLFDKGLIFEEGNGIKCSQFGKLIIRLYLYPASGVLIRNKLEDEEILDYQTLIKEAYEVLKAENRVRDYKMLNPLLDWADEEPMDEILERYNIMAGDLYSLRDNIERIIIFIGIIARHLSESSLDLQDKLSRVVEMAETLGIRIKFGIKEELFDLVLRINQVGRVRARILYNAGYHTATKVRKEKPYTLNKKTGLGINLCKKIIESKSKKD